MRVLYGRDTYEVSRSQPTDVTFMTLFCPECRATFDEERERCPHDDSRLFQLDSGEDPLIGMVVDERFRIDWLLGAGGMGAVYRATQLSVGREVALKVLKPDVSDRETSLERFFREAKLVSELTHPNIVRLIDFGQDRRSDLLYLVMELVKGMSLGDVLGKGRLRVAMALEVVYQICGALTEPHSRGVIHRDLKPDNVLIVPVSDGTLQVKVLDFGIARALQNNTQLTATGMICGTPAYMAPEQAQNFALDPRTDLYALGVMLYQMLSGRPPFEGTSSLQILLKHIQEKPRALGEVLTPGAIPEEVEALVVEMIAKNISERPASARAVRERIDAIRAKLSIAPVRLEGADPATIFEPWILPDLPQGSYVQSGPTQVLRRETNLEASPVVPSRTGLGLAQTAPMYREATLVEASNLPEAVARTETNNLFVAGGQRRASTTLIVGGMILFSLLAVGGFAIWLGSGSQEETVLSAPEVVVGEEVEASPAAVVVDLEAAESDLVFVDSVEEKADDEAVIDAGESPGGEASSAEVVEAPPAPAPAPAPAPVRAKATERPRRTAPSSAPSESPAPPQETARAEPDKTRATESKKTTTDAPATVDLFGPGGALRKETR